jgi:hypothetical protein
MSNTIKITNESGLIAVFSSVPVDRSLAQRLLSPHRTHPSVTATFVCNVLSMRYDHFLSICRLRASA